MENEPRAEVRRGWWPNLNPDAAEGPFIAQAVAFMMCLGEMIWGFGGRSLERADSASKGSGPSVHAAQGEKGLQGPSSPASPTSP